MSNVLEILNPNREFTLARMNLTVIVREMTWGDLDSFLKSVVGKFAALGAGLQSAQTSFSMESISDVIHGSSELCEEILTKATNLPPERIGELSISEVFGLIEQALDLNVASLASGSKKAFGRITNFVGKNAAGTLTPTATGSRPPSTS